MARAPRQRRDRAAGRAPDALDRRRPCQKQHISLEALNELLYLLGYALGMPLQMVTLTLLEDVGPSLIEQVTHGQGGRDQQRDESGAEPQR